MDSREKLKKEYEEYVFKTTYRPIEEYTYPLWSDPSFCFDALCYCASKGQVWDLMEFIDDNLWGDLSVILEAMNNIIDNGQVSLLPAVYEKVPKEKWRDEEFLDAAIPYDIHALDYVPRDARTKELMLLAFAEMPEQLKFNIVAYVDGYEYLIKKTPDEVFADKEFVDKLLRYLRNSYEGKTNPPCLAGDYQRLLALVDAKRN